jgi:peptide/nickel transport system substrate-binding protein
MRFLAILVALIALAGAAQGQQQASDAIAMRGAPALATGFDHLPYANPDAPKGGRLALAYLGAFDSLNPYNVKALSTAQGLIGNVYQSLMARSADEPFTLYGLIAQSIETDDARDWVVFRLDPRARFSDGTKIVAADVLFAFDLLKTKGLPSQREAYAQVRSATAPDELTVRFDLAGADDRELPLILALMPVLSRAHTDAAHFEDQTLQIPLGAGPYKVVDVVPGQSLTLARDPNYWGRDLPVNRGLYNFDQIRIDYFRDAAAMFEAFKAGLVDFRLEDDPTRWRDGYRFPAARDGRVLRDALPYGLPKGISGFAFNTRRPIFADPHVREGLATMFDFEWINANLYAGVYKRSQSFFDDSELSAAGRPASAKERALLAPFPGAARDDILEGRWTPPVSDGTGRDRAQARKALAQLGDAGFELRGATMVDPRGRPLSFEILVKTLQEERLALAYAASLARIGVTASVRLVDDVQFQRRRARFDFDMMIGSWIASPSPGNEQRNRWSSAAAAMEGSYNICGADSLAIDAMIAAVVAARDRDDFVAAVRALDRLLLSGFYIVPLFYAPDQWVAYASALGHPDRTPLFGVATETWWSAKP